jgi:hypothetical protein
MLQVRKKDQNDIETKLKTDLEFIGKHSATLLQTIILHFIFLGYGG